MVATLREHADPDVLLLTAGFCAQRPHDTPHYTHPDANAG